MPVKFLAADPDRGFLCVGRVKDWDNFELSRWNQAYRSALGEALAHAASQIYDRSNGGGATDRNGVVSLSFRVERELTREEQIDLARSLRTAGNSAANNGASGGSVGGLQWQLEIEKPEVETGEAA